MLSLSLTLSLSLSLSLSLTLSLSLSLTLSLSLILSLCLSVSLSLTVFVSDCTSVSISGAVSISDSQSFSVSDFVYLCLCFHLWLTFPLSSVFLYPIIILQSGYCQQCHSKQRHAGISVTLTLTPSGIHQKESWLDTARSYSSIFKIWEISMGWFPCWPDE